MSTTSDTTTTSERGDRRGCGCGGGCGCGAIQITNTGDVHVHACPGDEHPSPCRETCAECPAEPIAPGQCVPLAIGSKPKQSQRSKLDRLLANSPVPSALAAGFVQTSRRYLAGRAPATAFEAETFAVLRAMPAPVQRTLSCSLGSFDALGTAERNQLFDSTLVTDLDTPVDAARLASALAREITTRVGTAVFGDSAGVEQERPGRNRFFKPEGESFDIQLPIYALNGLRTNEFLPHLSPGDYKPEELQQHCEVVLVGGIPETSCEVQAGNCPGNFLSDGSQVTCLRVPEVRGGQSVELHGMNYISVDARIRLTAQPDANVTREVDAHVVGDVVTPLTETVGGQTVPIRDSRVHDRITFLVPTDLAPAVYAVQVVLPNVSGIPQLGDPIVSNPQFVRVVPPDSARFTITSETLTAVEETSPSFLGSDEVRVRVRAYPVTFGLTELLLGDELAFDSPEFGDLDSGDVRDMTALLFAHQASIDAMFLSITGFEIDSEQAYREQIDSFSEAFLHYLKVALAAIGAGLGATALAIGLKDLLALGLAHPIVLLIAAAIVVTVVLFLALWAPADEIISDSLGLTVADLADLTSVDVPMPAPSEYTTGSGIKVRVTPLEKVPSQYREQRDYLSDEEGSRYRIVLRYNRVA
ncbi:MAG TPA: hypothetical protein VFJ94_03740 [Intrasporangium sp.]|uniref:hypothetical protein n=1 Tax=Intrasporangium sp. TaxID=1925024 RepID=UPI002D7961F0|nr:hypothetical protein [Intrasporangium sp.]HET7397614.1 hypothetical protein [Intrasporangium sp.]